MIRRHFTLCPGLKGIEQELKEYGFRGPEDSAFGEKYEGNFADFGDSFDIIIYLDDAPEKGEYCKRLYIDCWSLSEDNKKERKMISKILSETKIRSKIIMGNDITPSL